MGKRKYLDYILRLFDKSPVVDFASINRIVKSQKKVKQYTKQLIRNLVKQGKIYKIGKGLYTSNKDSSLAVFGFTPGYLGLQDALSFHNLWEQETNTLIITSKKVRTGLRRILGVNVIVKRIDKKYLFGFDYYQSGDFYLPYSDIEKTAIDFVHFRIKLDEEVIKEFRKKIDMKKLRDYLKVYPKRTRERVLKVLRVNN